MVYFTIVSFPLLLHMILLLFIAVFIYTRKYKMYTIGDWNDAKIQYSYYMYSNKCTLSAHASV